VAAGATIGFNRPRVNALRGSRKVALVLVGLAVGACIDFDGEYEEGLRTTWCQSR
jgi:hypothetical protein